MPSPALPPVSSVSVTGAWRFLMTWVVPIVFDATLLLGLGHSLHGIITRRVYPPETLLTPTVYFASLVAMSLLAATVLSPSNGPVETRFPFLWEMGVGYLLPFALATVMVVTLVMFIYDFTRRR